MGEIRRRLMGVQRSSCREASKHRGSRNIRIYIYIIYTSEHICRDVYTYIYMQERICPYILYIYRDLYMCLSETSA